MERFFSCQHQFIRAFYEYCFTKKERMRPEDLCVLSFDGFISAMPTPKTYSHRPPNCTDCAPVFMKVYEMFDAAAVIHSHALESCLLTMINLLSKEFQHMEVIKGIQGHGYEDELVVPLIEKCCS